MIIVRMKRDTILIGSEDWDYSTDAVMQWLKFYGEKVIRVNMEDEPEIESVDIGHGQFDFRIGLKNGDSFSLTQIKSYWLRRSELQFISRQISFGEGQSFSHVQKSLNRHLKMEIKTVQDFLEYVFKTSRQIRTLGANANYAGNKLINLKVAEFVGLKIPATSILSSKQALANLLKNTPSLITKTISDLNPIHFKIDEKNFRYVTYTNPIDGSHLPAIQDEFFPSLFQNHLEKKLEIRIFYLAGKCFAMAIFSQNDDKTKTDFRRYNNVTPNMRAPFELPDDIQEKIRLFMQKIELDCGSIDMVYTKIGEFVFLEVNPFGQFGMVSFPCNYYLEKEIADYLCGN